MNINRLYYFGCIPFRIFIATILLLGINPMVGPVSALACIALLMAAGFARNHWTQKDVGFFGGKVWWDDFRMFHAGVWVLIATFLFFDVRFAGILVLYDLLPGIMEKCNGVRTEEAST